MIRDSIVVIDKFNAMSKNSHDNVRIIASVRNEVINSVNSRGKEINKIIESYGIPIDWSLYKEEKTSHPLIQVLINYLRLSDPRNIGYRGYTDQFVYNEWVADSFYNNLPSESTLLDFTLNRPRHVVRFLRLVKRLSPDSKQITKLVFETIKREYARECWNEVTEDLSLKYSSSELIEIQEWLTGMPYFTTYNDMLEKAKTLWSAKELGKQLLDKFDELLRDIYKAGIIGNIMKEYSRYDYHMKHRWAFRGDDVLMKTEAIQIHRIFQAILSTTRPRKNVIV